MRTPTLLRSKEIHQCGVHAVHDDGTGDFRDYFASYSGSFSRLRSRFLFSESCSLRGYILSSPRLQKVVLHSQVLSDVRLVQHDHGRWVKVFAKLRRLGRHTEPQWDVAHAVHHRAAVLWSVLRYSAQPRLLNVVAVQEGHLRARFHPYFILQRNTKRLDIFAHMARRERRAGLAYGQGWIGVEAKRLRVVRGVWQSVGDRPPLSTPKRDVINPKGAS